MKNFSKGAAFLVFGVLCSPIMFGLLPTLLVYEMTESILAVIAATIISFSSWAVVREMMIARKWHYHL